MSLDDGKWTHVTLLELITLDYFLAVWHIDSADRQGSLVWNVELVETGILKK